MDKNCKSLFYILYCASLSTLLFTKVEAISCYDCDSSKDMTCGEALADGHTLIPSNCSDLQEHKYCVKMTGLYEASSLYCYQCDSTKDNFCPERVTQIHHDSGFSPLWQPKSCGHLYQPRYCIKTTGIFEGELGTKRFCSARDFGNYCEMVRRPGDERLYRACVYTCQTHSCNLSTNCEVKFTLFLTMVATTILLPLVKPISHY